MDDVIPEGMLRDEERGWIGPGKPFYGPMNGVTNRRYGCGSSWTGTHRWMVGGARGSENRWSNGFFKAAVSIWGVVRSSSEKRGAREHT